MEEIIRGNRIKNEKDKSIDLKELDGNYVHYLDKKLPSFLNRGDLYHGNRLLGYADAILATCATFFVIPLQNFDELSENETLEIFLTNLPRFMLFVFRFLLVSTIWESVNIRSLLIKHVDDFYVMFMVLYLLIVFFLPFSSLGFIPCLVLISLELLEVVMNIYTFKTPRLLHFYIQGYTEQELAHAKTMLYLKNVVNIALYLLTFTCGVVFLGYTCYDDMSWLFLALLLLLPYIRNFIFFVHRKIYGFPTNEHCIFFTRFKKGDISKDRVEAFTDSAVAIIACVLILNITVEGFPKKAGIAKHGLYYSLINRLDEFAMAVMTYLTVSMLWYMNHTVLQLFHTIDKVTLSLQKILLLSICCIPLASQVVDRYMAKNNNDTTIAITFYGVVVLIGSCCNLLMFVWGVYTKEKVFHKWANFNDNIKTNCKKHAYIILKLLNPPFWCLMCLFGTFGPPMYASIIMVITVACKMLTFVILKLLLGYNVGRYLVFDEVEVNSVCGNPALSQSNSTGIENNYANLIAENEKNGSKFVSAQNGLSRDPEQGKGMEIVETDVGQ